MDHYLPAVHRALAYTNENLKRPITLEGISQRAGFSLWHFQRIFAAYVGEPLGTHLRRRRLVCAAKELHETSRGIIEVALDYQFESHAAFTRAFVAELGMTPSELRRKPQLPRFLAQPEVTPAQLLPLSRHLTMKPEILPLPALTLLGLEARFIGPMSPDANNHQVIPPLFRRFFQRTAELPPALDGYTYGACDCLPEKDRSREDELSYLVSVSVAKNPSAPNGMKIWQVPAATYALFVHRGPVTRIGETMSYIYGTWLARSDYEQADGPSLERYDERFGDGGVKSEFEILVPVRLRAACGAKK